MGKSDVKKSKKEKKEKKEKKVKTPKKEKKEKKKSKSTNEEVPPSVEVEKNGKRQADDEDSNPAKKANVHSNGFVKKSPKKMSEDEIFTKDLDEAMENKENKEAKPEISQEEKDGSLENFDISDLTLKNLKACGYKYLFPIQAKTFSHIMKGKDIFGKARTGEGKTLSFALPVVEKLLAKPDTSRGRQPRTLVMAPTRELAIQVHKEFAKVGPSLKSTCIYGGTDYEPQRSALRNGLDIVVGTPGRLLDHMENKTLGLANLRYLILDEADRMLEVGFVEHIETILKAASEQAGTKPQMILFSATLPDFIKSTLNKYMPNHIVVDTIGNERNRTSKGVKHLALKCPWHARKEVIADVVQVYSGAHGRTMIFTQTKKDANELALDDTLKQDVQVLHGDISQKQREISLQCFRDGKVRCLVATDVAARGIDIPEVDLVVQCEPPQDVESYIHRSGRTGRAGRKGVCICFYKPNQEDQLRQVERRARINFTRVGPPQPADIIKAGARDATQFLDNVTDSVIDHFEDAAKDLIGRMGDPVKALSAALAHISGSTTIKGRSLLSSLEGYTALHISTMVEMRGKGYVWNIIERHMPEGTRPAVRGLRLQADKQGAVFDVPEDMVKKIMSTWNDSDSVQLKVCDELPELEEDQRFGGNNRGSFGGRQGGWGRQGGNRGGSFGGRGGGNRFGNGGGNRFGGRGGGRGGGGFRRNSGGRGGKY